MFMNKVAASYSVVTADALDNQFKKLAADIIALEYAPAEEQKLLNMLKETYKDLSKAKRTKSAIAVTAEMNWDAIIKENYEKKLKMKKQRELDNANTLSSNRIARPDRPEVDNARDPIKRKVAHEVEQMGNIIKFDFSHPQKKEVEPKLNKEDKDFGDRMSRIRSSLEKINTLMAELKKMSAEDQKKKAKLKPVKTAGKPRRPAKPNKKKKAG